MSMKKLIGIAALALAASGCDVAQDFKNVYDGTKRKAKPASASLQMDADCEACLGMRNAIFDVYHDVRGGGRDSFLQRDLESEMAPIFVSIDRLETSDGYLSHEELQRGLEILTNEVARRKDNADLFGCLRKAARQSTYGKYGGSDQ